jgi:hypothetical protein
MKSLTEENDMNDIRDSLLDQFHGAAYRAGDAATTELVSLTGNLMQMQRWSETERSYVLLLAAQHVAAHVMARLARSAEVTHGRDPAKHALVNCEALYEMTMTHYRAMKAEGR